MLPPRSSDALAVRLEQGQVGPRQRLRRFGAQFLDEHLSGLVVRGQGFAATAVLVQGEHELAPGSLIQRILLQRPAQLPDHLGAATAAQVGLDPIRLRGAPHLLDVLHHRA